MPTSEQRLEQLIMHMSVKGHDFVKSQKWNPCFFHHKQKKMSLSFSINATHSQLSVISHRFTTNLLCQGVEWAAGTTGRHCSSLVQRWKARVMSPVPQQTYVTELNHPNSKEKKETSRFWSNMAAMVQWFDTSSTCNHYYAASSGKSCLNRERCDPAPLLPISSFVSASVESPHLWGNPVLQQPQLQMGWMSLYSDPIRYRSWDLYYIYIFLFIKKLFLFYFVFFCITFQFLISVWLNYTQEQCSV